jgi:hypothetical protein
MQDQTRSFLNLMTVFIGQIPDKANREQLEYALARMQAITDGDLEGACTLVPPASVKPSDVHLR